MKFKKFYLWLLIFTVGLFLFDIACLALGGLGLVIAGSINGSTWWLAYLVEYSLIAIPVFLGILIAEFLSLGIPALILGRKKN
ncbi:MAG: hypothetical protein K2G44_05580 [Clostridia bacterium]|nr:hypothetical protein [Clostridia bacterium]